jgi:hypothetical protein
VVVVNNGFKIRSLTIREEHKKLSVDRKGRWRTFQTFNNEKPYNLNTTNISRRQVRRGGHVKLKESSDERT